MKTRVKYKDIFAALIILFSFSWNVNAAFERSASPYENKFEDPFSRASSGNSPSVTRGMDPADPAENSFGEESSPVGDALLLLTGFGLAYGIYVYSRKSKNIQYVQRTE
jgi:hypothetical protein